MGVVLVVSAVFLHSCKKSAARETENNQQPELKDLAQYVDPMIGTAKMGHTYPGATVPFGSVQLSPATDTIPYAVNGQNNSRMSLIQNRAL